MRLLVTVEPNLEGNSVKSWRENPDSTEALPSALSEASLPPCVPAYMDGYSAQSLIFFFNVKA